MSKSNPRLVFGPVPSRRLGRSLGIDVLPKKTCSYDCIYCQVGKTTSLVCARKEFVSPPEVMAQLKQALEEGVAPDVITISGSGEPTLYLQLGQLIQAIKKQTETPVVVLTNGSLLFLPEVREELLAADLVAPNLDAGDAETFQKINRPHPEIRFEEMVSGLTKFAKEFSGRLLLEVFLVQGINDREEQVKKIAEIASELDQATVQLNTVTRPPAEKFAQGVPRERLQELAHLFSPPAEVIADYQARAKKKEVAGVKSEEVLELLARRPCTLSDLTAGLLISPAQARKLLDHLVEQKRVTATSQGDKIYYSVLEK